MNRDLLISILLSFVPVSELRGGIPYGYFHHLPLSTVAPFCILANMLVPFVCWAFLGTVHKLFYRHWTWYRTKFDVVLERSRKKVQPSIEKYGFWGLMVFVGIPLPMTGAWTGAIAAWLLGIPKHKALLATACGVAIAGLIVSLVVVGGSSVGNLFLKQF